MTIEEIIKNIDQTLVTRRQQQQKGRGHDGCSD
jgi:hypothetical protein